MAKAKATVSEEVSTDKSTGAAKSVSKVYGKTQAKSTRGTLDKRP